MSTDMSRKYTVVVADRAHAYVYETPRIGAVMSQVAVLNNPNARMHERDLGSDAPGRAFNRSSGIHQTYSPKHGLQQQDAVKFARVVGKTVELSVRSPSCSGVVIIAAPRMLSAIRRSLPKVASDKVIRAIAKDLVHMPTRVIVEHLKAA